jgi:S1-C subfamily serine protease
MTSTMGTEIKLTTGVISSRSGYQGDVSTYQVSVPVQPGNSGGPLFNYKGELIGIINAKHTGAENVSYAIKTSYVRNLIESFTNDVITPNNNKLSGNDLPEQVKQIKPYVYLIQCKTY